MSFEQFPIYKSGEDKNNFKDKVLDMKNKIVESKTLKMAVLFLAMLGPMKATEAQTANHNPENIKNRIENTKVLLNRINGIFNSNDDRVSSHDQITDGVNNKYKTFKFFDNAKMSRAENGSFIKISIENGRIIYYDDDSNGSIDRIVVNNSADDGFKEMRNNSFTVNSMKSISEEQQSSVSVGTNQDISIMDINYKDNTVKILSSDNEYKINSLEGEKADKIIEQAQTYYYSELKQIHNEEIGLDYNNDDTGVGNFIANHSAK